MSVQLESQVRALRKQGALLAKERDHFVDSLIEFDEGTAAVLKVLQRREQEIRELQKRLTACHDFRHKLIVKLKEERAKRLG